MQRAGSRRAIVTAETILGTPSSGTLRPGLRVFAVGDIHGHADLLGRIATLVADDLAKSRPAAASTVFLGDYIDRGPAASAVVDRLVHRAFPTPIVTLRGNHEQMLLDGLEDPRRLEDWLFNGGAETAQSYGVDVDRRLLRDPDALADALAAAIPQSHITFLRGTALSHTVDGYFFCHAGIEPGIPLDRQEREVLLWIRQSFHASTADHGKVVVHGHTPVPKPEMLPNRINIDTGAFYSGRLTCLVLEGAERRILQTGP